MSPESLRSSHDLTRKTRNSSGSCSAGVFVAIVGPSGAGKDTLMREARKLLAGRADIRFARRVVTRVADKTLEDHDTLDDDAFQQAAARGDFCLSWQAHRLKYGLPRVLQDEMQAGCVVVANISRRVIAEAVRIFPVMDVIEITAQPEIRAERLLRRGRETEAGVRERISREAECNIPPAVRRFIRIDNSSELSHAARKLAESLQSS